ncbi:MAG TPA: M15 family metallopeptidase [Xanthobacteraceae bacterium]|nr:M15 family metallopeptidase [Xanthobacteraceae bacterium]
MPQSKSRAFGGKACVLAGLALVAGCTRLLFAQDDQVRLALDNLIAAYPQALAGHDAKMLRWRDGTVMAVSDGDDGKTFPELLRHASILDQFRIPYPRGPLAKPPSADSDPGRFRNTAFFTKMYGDCRKGEVSPHLVSLVWLPKAWGKSIRVTSVNNVDAQLRAVSDEIDALPDAIKRAAYPIAGTYNCRTVADTGQPSPHGYGIAIDLNIAFSDYWYWRPPDGAVLYRNRMPQEIVAIFEKHGFIWGGKWFHFDTMHFEFRPELLVAE